MNAKARVLIVEDEPQMLMMIRMVLDPHFDVATAPGPEEALPLITRGNPFAVVLSDQNMPYMTGVEFLALVKERSPDTTRMMLTGDEENTTAMDAVNRGQVFRFLTKPVDAKLLLRSVNDGLAHHRVITAEKQLLTETLSGAIRVLADLLGIAAPESFRRSHSVQEKMRTMATHLKLENVWELEAAALLARIGEMSLPPEVLTKARAGLPASSQAMQMLLHVPEFGYKLVAQIPRLENVAHYILYQAKHFNGSGFPTDSVAGTALPLGARMLCVLEAIAAHESNGHSPATALREMEKNAGLYDPEIMIAASQCFGTPFFEEKVEVRLKDLTVGARVAEAVTTRGGMTIFGAQTVITEALLQRLRNFADLKELKEPIIVHTGVSA